MKKIIFFSLIAVLFFSCKPGSYDIQGTVKQDVLNGKYVYITERINRVWIPVDSVKVENGKFKFSGVCDSSRVIFVSCEVADEEMIREPFVFENGTITITIDQKNVTVGGTEQNDLLQKYMTVKNGFYAQAEALYKNFDDSTASKAQKEAFEKQMAGFEKKITQNDIEYATRYVNTVVGNYVFGSSFFGMTVDEKEKIVSLMNEDSKSNSRIAEIIAAIAVEKSTSKGQKFTDIELSDINGNPKSLSSLIGKSDYVLVDFWASWCGPCMKSLPDLKALYEKYKGQKLEILGVSLDEDSIAWKSTIKTQKINWIHISDLQGWKSAGASKYAVRSIPATVLIDKNGVIVGRNMNISEIESMLLSGRK